MKKLLTWSLAWLLPLSLWAKMPDEIDFVIVIPSYNNANYCIKNLESVAMQTYPFWEAVYINDCSTDQTGPMVEEFVRTHSLQSKIKIFHTKKNVGAMANFYKHINKIKSKKIVVHLDGDDRLAHPQVLERLAYTYADKNVWITYGNYRPEPAEFIRLCAPLPPRVLKKNRFRKAPWVTSHLRSYYAKLFHNIKKKHLMYKGAYVPMAADQASMFCILEQASRGHIKYISEELYIYNYQNPINDEKKDLWLVQDVERHLRKMKRYKPLKKLF